MDIKNSRRFLLTTLAGGLAFFGIKKITKIIDRKVINDKEVGKLVVKPHQDAINRQRGGML